MKIDVGKEYSLNPTLEVGGAQETVTVTAGNEVINSTNAELSNTITETQLLGLPINGRDPSSLIQLQPGVTQGGQINGLRTSAQNITRDGLNVQDNFIRTGDFNVDHPLNVVCRDHTRQNSDIFRIANLNEQIPTAGFNITLQNVIPILRTPHNVRGQARNRVMRLPIIFYLPQFSHRF